MRVLTRRSSQTITFASPGSPKPAIEVKVIEVREGQVKLRVSSPHVLSFLGLGRKDIWVQKRVSK